MTPSAPLSSRMAESAVLLVLLPVAAGQARSAQQATTTALTTLQQQLGPAIRVLRVDEASHPVVVRSFQPVDLPALVLVQQGVELWRQQGLPEGNALGPLLLSKLRPAS